MNLEELQKALEKKQNQLSKIRAQIKVLKRKIAGKELEEWLLYGDAETVQEIQNNRTKRTKDKKPAK